MIIEDLLYGSIMAIMGFTAFIGVVGVLGRIWIYFYLNFWGGK